MTYARSGIVMSRLLRAPSEARRIIGHCDLANEAQVWHGDDLYVSVREAVCRIMQGEENVAVHLTLTDEDVAALDHLRLRALRRWAASSGPDGWTGPLPLRPEQRVPAKEGDDGSRE